MLNGVPTLAVPATLEAVVFWTVKVASTAVPTAVLPTFTEPAGLTLRSARATPLTGPAHPLSLPDWSTALMRAT
jgi:hypothetical protein